MPDGKGQGHDEDVVLKIVSDGSPLAPYAQLASELVMSASEVHACVKRAQTCHLLHGSQLNHRPNIAAVEEFLVHGLYYIFPSERGELTRGVPTSYPAEPLRSLIAPGTEPMPVWAITDGDVRGVSFAPLYKAAPIAALRDSCFHAYLALADALRAGRARERKLAEAALHKRLRATDGPRKHLT